MQSFVSIYHILQRLGRARATTLVLLLLVSSSLEGLGIATLLPLLFMAAGDHAAGNASPLAQQVTALIRALGLPVTMGWLTLLAAGLLVLREFLNFLIQTYAGYTIARITAEQRQRLLQRFACAAWGYFQRNMLGALNIGLVQFTENAAAAMEFAVQATTTLLRTFIYIVLILLFSGFSGLFTLLAFAAAVLLFSPLLILIRLTRKYSGKYAQAFQTLGAQFADVFTSIKVIRAMALEEAVQPLFARLVQRLKRLKKRLVIVRAGLVALQGLVTVVLVFGMLYAAFTWFHVSVVEMGIMAGLVLAIVKGFSRTQTIMQKSASLEPYLWRLEEIVIQADASCERVGGRTAPPLEKGIAFRDVTFAYPGRPVFERIRLFMPARRINVLMGPSGSGKTTIVDLIIGLYEPQGGEILVDDVPLSEIDLKDWRSHIGYVPQELVLLSGTVRDNITLGVKVGDEDVWRALRLAGAEDFVRRLPQGLDTEIGERGLRLSGGQRQRLSLARALVRRPRLLVLDEVTSALDPKTENLLVHQIADLVHRENLTAIAITHTRAWLAVADRVFRVEDGRVSEESAVQAP